MPRKKNKSLFDNIIEFLFPTPRQLAVKKANKKWKHMPTGNNSQRKKTIRISEENNETFLIGKWSDTNFQKPTNEKKRINSSSPKNLKTPKADLKEQVPSSNHRKREHNIELDNPKNYLPKHSNLPSNHFSRNIEQTNEELIFGNSDSFSTYTYQGEPNLLDAKQPEKLSLQPSVATEHDLLSLFSQGQTTSHSFDLSSTRNGTDQQALNDYRQRASYPSRTLVIPINNQEQEQLFKQKKETETNAFQSHLDTSDSSDYYCLVTEV